MWPYAKTNRATPAPRWLAAGLLASALVAFAAEVDSRADEASLAGPDAPSTGPAAANSKCEACHEDVAREWRSSLHRQAYSDPTFQAALAVEPLPFCRGCHAPEADPTAVSASAGALGVGCVTCHLGEDGEIVGARALAATTQGHTVRFDPRLTRTDACATCHQFDFPAHPGAAMQSTLDEHAASRYAKDSCQSCHMPLAAGAAGSSHRRHDFRVQGDAALLASAVDVRARRGSYGTIDLVLTPGRIGHAFPTGDMFRHLVLRATALDSKGKLAMTANPVLLGRRFALVEHGGGSVDRYPVADDRVPPPGPTPTEAVVTLRFPDKIDGLEIRWELAYRRVDAVLGAALGLDADVDETLIAKGALKAR